MPEVAQPDLPVAKGKAKGRSAPRPLPGQYVPSGSGLSGLGSGATAQTPDAITQTPPWRVAEFELLQAELPGLKIEDMPALHALLARPGNEWAWLMVRRLFGVFPIMRSLTDNPDDFRVWPRAEYLEKTGKTKEQLAAELEAVRAHWQRVKMETERNPHPGPLPSDGRGRDEVRPPIEEEDEDTVLRRHHFRPDIFEKAGREAEATRLEKAWFVQQVLSLSQWLLNARTQEAASNVLRISLRCRRANDDYFALQNEPSPTDETQKESFEQRNAKAWEAIEGVQRQYQGAVKLLSTLAPEFAISAGEVRSEEAFADGVKRMQEYKSWPNTALVDGVHTGPEIQEQLRTSIQQPRPMYRPAFVSAINESYAHLFNQHYKNEVPDRYRAIIDKAFQEAVAKLKEEKNMHVPNLLRDGSEGEYEPLELAEGAGAG